MDSLDGYAAFCYTLSANRGVVGVNILRSKSTVPIFVIWLASNDETYGIAVGCTWTLFIVFEIVTGYVQHARFVFFIKEVVPVDWNLVFFLNSVLLGVGLAMDAFSVSVANGLLNPQMKQGTAWKIAGTFAAFQAAMPMIGWICVHTIVVYFKAFEKLIPWIALLLLGYIGGKMLIEGIRSQNDEEEEPKSTLSGAALFMAGVATSIDALSVGFTIAEYSLLMAVTASLIIAIVTLAICLAGIEIGKKFGDIFGKRAEMLGGIILIGIGLEIFITGVF